MSRDIEHHPTLSFLRASIDNIDSALLSLLLHRSNIVRYIKQYKTLHALSPSRSIMRHEAINEIIVFASSLHLREHFIRNIFDQLYEESEHLECEEISGDIKKFLFQNKNMLAEFNQSLKNVDLSFCALLSERMHLVRKVGVYKKQQGLPLFAPARWESVLATKVDMAKSLHINPEVVRKLYTMIHEEALEVEAQD